MKSAMLSMALACATVGAAAAAPFAGVPEPLGGSLGMHQVKEATWKNGVLRVQLQKAEVSELVYYTFIYHGICAEQWHKPEAFNKMGLTRTEVLDATGAKGFAFDGDAAVCAEMGSMGKRFGNFIGERTSKCEAGACAKRK
ncbi:MAG: hypothetical protein E6Q78_16465 [Rhodoferax sp.]|nr:MAG: hypothetical protein E6Q78_16465 [Rhodoferax sp.]